MRNLFEIDPDATVEDDPDNMVSSPDDETGGDQPE